MSRRKIVMPPEVLKFLREQGQKTGAIGGKTAARNMTPEQRKARSKKGAAVREARRKTK